MRVASLVFASALCAGAGTGAAAQQATAPESVQRISVTWSGASIHDVLHTFAAYSGRSIVPGVGVSGLVTADINDQPWDVALGAVLRARGLGAVEDEYGIIRVERLEDLTTREAVEPVRTRVYQLSYALATEMEAALGALLSERGTISSVPSTNTVIISDVARVHAAVSALLPGGR